MSLIATNKLVVGAVGSTSVCDSLASDWTELVNAANRKSVASPGAGTCRGTANALLTLVAGLADFRQLTDLLNPANDNFLRATADNMAAGRMQEVINGIQNHLASADAKAVSTSIVDLASYLTYYNGGGGGSKFSTLVTPDFADLFAIMFPTASPTLPAVGVMCPALQPDYNSPYASGLTGFGNGMGQKTVGGSYVQGAVVPAAYSAVVPIFEVITTISGGSGTISVTVTGVDDNGNAATWGPTVLTGGNNPAAALSGITITPSVNAYSRQTVAFSSATGIIPGSVLTIAKNKPDQEVIVVEGVSGSNVTAVFKQAHGAGATVDGWTTTAAGNASTGAGRRCASISAITFTINGHSAGVVRVSGAQDRVAV